MLTVLTVTWLACSPRVW